MGRSMKKRILSWILCMAVLLTGLDFAPVVKAAGEDEHVVIMDDQDAEKMENGLAEAAEAENMEAVIRFCKKTVREIPG